MKRIAAIMVLLAGASWGCMGIFVRMLRAAGLGAMDLVFIRTLLTVILLFAIICIRGRNRFRIRVRDLRICAVSAVVGVILFSYCYFNSMNMMSISVAVVLAYTSPVFTIIISRLVYKEAVTAQRVVSLGLILAGTVFVAGLIGSSPTVTLAGFLFGVGTSVSGALIPIFNKAMINRGYTALTITFYTYVLAAVISMLFADLRNAFTVFFSDARIISAALGLAAVNTVLPFLLINTALQYIDPGYSSLLGAIDPVVSTMVSVFFFHETLTGTMFLGIALIVAGIVFCNIRAGQRTGRGGGPDAVRGDGPAGRAPSETDLRPEQNVIES